MHSISRRGRTQFVYSRDGESKDALDNEAGPDEEDSAKVQDEEEARTFYHARALLLPNHLRTLMLTPKFLSMSLTSSEMKTRRFVKLLKLIDVRKQESLSV